MSNARLKDFLIDDLKKLKVNYESMKENCQDRAWNEEEIEQIDNFFMYWSRHIKNL